MSSRHPAHTCTPAKILDDDLEWIDGYVCCVCGRLLKISASGIKTFDLCPRRWAFEYVLGRKSPSTPATRFGSDVHDLAEALLKGVRIPPGCDPRALGFAEDAVRLSRGLVRTPELIEGDAGFTLPTGAGPVSYRGRIDLYGGGTLVDFKTAASPKWALTEDQLTTDTQLLSYVWGLRELGHDVHTVAHVQLFKDGTEARVIRAAAPDTSPIPGALRAKIDPIDKTARRAYLGDVHAADADTSACNAFNRPCHNEAACKHNTNPHRAPQPAPKGAPTMSDLQAHLANLRAASKPPEPPLASAEPATFNPPDAQPPAPPQPWAARDIDVLREIKGVGDAVIAALRAAGLNTCGDVWATGDLSHLPRVGSALSARIREELANHTRHPNPALRLPDPGATAPAPAAPPDLGELIGALVAARALATKLPPSRAITIITTHIEDALLRALHGGTL